MITLAAKITQIETNLFDFFSHATRYLTEKQNGSLRSGRLRQVVAYEK